MPMSFATANARLSRELPQTESAIEDALVASASLLLTAATARRDIGIRSPEAHAAMMRLNKLNQTLLEASTEARRAHRELRKIAGPEFGYDDAVDDCPPPPPIQAIDTASA